MKTCPPLKLTRLLIGQITPHLRKNQILPYAFVLLAIIPLASAQAITYSNATQSGFPYWGTSNTWTPNGVPGAGDDVVIGSPGGLQITNTYTLGVGTAANGTTHRTVNSLTLSPAATSINFQSTLTTIAAHVSTLTITDTLTANLTNNNAILRFRNGGTNTAALTINASNFVRSGTSGAVQLGDTASSVDYLTAFNISGTSTLSGQVQLGRTSGNASSDNVNFGHLVLNSSGSLNIFQHAGAVSYDATVRVSSLTSSNGAGIIQVNGSAGDDTGRLVIEGLSDANYSGVLRDVLTPTNNTSRLHIVKNGQATQILSGTNTYTGTTTVNAGALVINSPGGLAAGSAVAINGGTLRYNSASALAANVSLTGGRFEYNSGSNYSGVLSFTSGTLGGTNWNGAQLGGRSIGAGQVINPGSGVGSAATTSQTWANAGSYEWNINRADGSAGQAGGGWDLLNLSGSLTLGASSSDPFTIRMVSLGLNQLPGEASGFDKLTSYAWLIASSASPVENFNTSKFLLDSSGFMNSYDGVFGVARGDSVAGGDLNQLYVTYTAVPEPSVWSFMLLGALVVGITMIQKKHADRVLRKHQQAS